MQRITTKEPTEDMLEIAIISLKCALRDDFPEFKEFYELKAWEPKKEAPEAADETGDASADKCEESAPKSIFAMSAEQLKKSKDADASSDKVEASPINVTSAEDESSTEKKSSDDAS
jgi:hypothetical protein